MKDLFMFERRHLLWLQWFCLLCLGSFSLIYAGCANPADQCPSSCTAAQQKCTPEGVLLCLPLANQNCTSLVLQRCPAGQSCQVSNGIPGCSSPGGGGTCTKLQHTKGCVGNDVHWFDDCNQARAKIQSCPAGQACQQGACVSSCPNACTAGSKRCSALGRVELCQAQSNGCAGWSPGRPCAPGQLCQAGQCVVQCQQVCQTNQKRCNGKQVQVCQVNASGCPDWKATQTCANAQSCVNGVCNQACQNQCSAGQNKCSGAQIQACVKNAQGCAVWSQARACPQGQACNQGKCQTASGCKPCNAGAIRCAGNAIEACTQDNKGCTAWVKRACPQGQRCVNNRCQRRCPTPCKNGQTRCSGRDIQLCEVDVQGCYVWKKLRTCAAGQSCSNGKCSSGCKHQCSAGQKRCTSAKLQSCAKDSKGCLVWTNGVACPSGQVCVNNKCGSATDPAARSQQVVCSRWKRDFPAKSSPQWKSKGNCDAGSIAQGSIDDAVRRASLYRWLIGLPPVVEEKSFSRDAQICAILQANNTPFVGGNTNPHKPPTNAKCYTKTGAATSGRSNLSWGMASPADSVSQFVADRNVPSLGHRLWVLSPRVGRTGFGFASGSNRYRTAVCQVVFDSTGRGSSKFLAFPSAGFFPIQAMNPIRNAAVSEWSFLSSTSRIPSGTKVTLTRLSDNDKQTLNTRRIGGYGNPNGVSFKPRFPKAGEHYKVEIGTVVSYTVKFFDCR